MVGAMISVLGKGCLIAGNVYIAVLLLPDLGAGISNSSTPIMVIGFFAYAITSLFLDMFSFSSTAILHCFILDEDFGGSDKTPDSLKEFLQMNEAENAKNIQIEK
jgi:hypothetical protein